MADFTPKQGQYLAFIHADTEGFGFPPAESEIAKAIKVSPPSVNQMMKTLERKNLIRRRAGVPRSIEILVSPRAIPSWKKCITSTQKIADNRFECVADEILGSPLFAETHEVRGGARIEEHFVQLQKALLVFGFDVITDADGMMALHKCEDGTVLGGREPIRD